MQGVCICQYRAFFLFRHAYLRQWFGAEQGLGGFQPYNNHHNHLVRIPAVYSCRSTSTLLRNRSELLTAHSVMLKGPDLFSGKFRCRMVGRMGETLSRLNTDQIRVTQSQSQRLQSTEANDGTDRWKAECHARATMLKGPDLFSGDFGLSSP